MKRLAVAAALAVLAWAAALVIGPDPLDTRNPIGDSRA